MASNVIIGTAVIVFIIAVAAIAYFSGVFSPAGTTTVLTTILSGSTNTIATQSGLFSSEPYYQNSYLISTSRIRQLQ